MRVVVVQKAPEQGTPVAEQKQSESSGAPTKQKDAEPDAQAAERCETEAGRICEKEQKHMESNQQMDPTGTGQLGANSRNGTDKGEEDRRICKTFEEALRVVKTEMKQRNGLEVVHMRGDGNCLFRAVSAQIFGDADWHQEIRNRVVEYMVKEKVHFRDFVTGDFDHYIRKMSLEGTFGSNPEIQAVAELYNRTVLVYAPSLSVVRASSCSSSSSTSCSSSPSVFSPKPSPGFSKAVEVNISKSIRPMNIFQGSYKQSDAPIRLFFVNGNHYDLVLDPYEASVGVGLGLPSFEPGKVEKDLIEETRKKSLAEFSDRRESLESDLLEKIKRESLRDCFESFPNGGRHADAQLGATQERARKRTHSKIEDDLKGECPAVVQELVCNGFDLNDVMEAYDQAGDSFDDILRLLLTKKRCTSITSSSSSSN